MTMRLFLLTILLATASIVLAQPHPPRGDRAMRMIDRLDLTPSQRAKIEAVRTKYHDLFAHNFRTNRDAATRRERRRVLQRDFRQELQAILTPSQLRELRTAMRDEMREEAPLRETLAQMELSQEQRQQIRLLLVQNKDRLDSIRHIDALPPAEMHKTVQQLKHETMNRLELILSPQQAEYLRKRMHERRRRLKDQ